MIVFIIIHIKPLKIYLILYYEYRVKDLLEPN